MTCNDCECISLTGEFQSKDNKVMTVLNGDDHQRVIIASLCRNCGKKLESCGFSDFFAKEWDAIKRGDTTQVRYKNLWKE